MREFVIGETYVYSPPSAPPAVSSFANCWYVPGVIRITGVDGVGCEYEVVEGMSSRLPHHKFDIGSQFADWLEPMPEQAVEISMSFEEMMFGSHAESLE